jgi:Arc/MetJ family transcription regulator
MHHSMLKFVPSISINERGFIMRTTLALDDELLAQAQELTGIQENRL